jgi:hypothetical protein
MLKTNNRIKTPRRPVPTPLPKLRKGLSYLPKKPAEKTPTRRKKEKITTTTAKITNTSHPALN